MYTAANSTFRYFEWRLKTLALIDNSETMKSNNCGHTIQIQVSSTKGYTGPVATFVFKFKMNVVSAKQDGVFKSDRRFIILGEF